MNSYCLLPLLLLAAIGCASSSSPPSQEELREHNQLEANAAAANKLFESGTIHAGQDVKEFLQLCKPYRADFADRYTFIEFYPVPNLYGLSVIAIDGKLASAWRWTCQSNEPIFETLSEEEKRTALAVYDRRIR